jgi:hypothetical protein
MGNNLTPIQQLTTTQRLARVQQMTVVIAANAITDVTLSSKLSEGTQHELISNLEDHSQLTTEMNDLLNVTKYLLTKFAGKENDIKLTKCQLALAIQELDDQLTLIDQQTPRGENYRKEYCETKKLKKKLEKKYHCA